MQKEFTIVKMTFTSPLHLSKGKEDDYGKTERILHADTLQSAIFVCALQIVKNDVNLNELFTSFQVSSGFPFCESVYFFPKPLSDINFIHLKDEDKKKIKKIAYFEKEDFEKILQGEELVYDETKTKKEEYYTKLKVEIKNEVIQRVAIPRFGDSDATPYYTDKIYFGNNTGMYFIIEFKDKKYEKVIWNALEILGTNGVGTDKSVGNGQFKYAKETLIINLPDKPTHLLNLSLFCPENKENLPDLNKSYYQIIKRGGWIANSEEENNGTYRKKSVYTFAEGSVFPYGNYVGKIVDLKPEELVKHSIWRDGRGMFLGIKANKN